MAKSERWCGGVDGGVYTVIVVGRGMVRDGGGVVPCGGEAFVLWRER